MITWTHDTEHTRNTPEGEQEEEENDDDDECKQYGFALIISRRDDDHHDFGSFFACVFFSLVTYHLYPIYSRQIPFLVE